MTVQANLKIRHYLDTKTDFECSTLNPTPKIITIKHNKKENWRSDGGNMNQLIHTNADHF